MLQAAALQHGAAPPQKDMNLQVLLDYRCHAPGGKVGSYYPFKFRQCIKWLKDNSVASIVDRFGFESESEAAFVQKRARSLHDLGFEGAVRNAQRELEEDTSPGNKASIYHWPEPCCSLVGRCRLTPEFRS